MPQILLSESPTHMKLLFGNLQRFCERFSYETKKVPHKVGDDVSEYCFKWMEPNGSLTVLKYSCIGE